LLNKTPHDCDLQNRQLKVFLNENVFNPEWPGLRGINPQLAFKATSADFISFWLGVVNVSDTNTSTVELLALADSCGPPFLDLKNRHFYF
jgi:hypothetical protein